MSLPQQNKNFKTIIALFFVISGATGLIYQIVWFKYLALFLGNTTYAQMIVLSTFLGGLAFGNYYFGKRADALTNPIRLYAYFELTIGIYCALYPLISSLFGDAFISVASSFNVDGRNFLFNGGRFFISAILLFIPTVAMGGTLPVLSKHFINNAAETRKELAVLYFLNSLGAVWGIIFAGFQLIEAIGLDGTIYIAAGINILIGFAAFVISHKTKLQRETIEEKIEHIKESRVLELTKPALRFIILIAGISGMASLLYEMVWTRLFINIFGSSTYAFSIMLLAFISGITIGSFVVSQKFMGKFNKVKLVAFFQTAIAFSTMIVLLLYERLPYILWKTSSFFDKTPDTFGIFLTLEFFICFSILIVPTIFMGMTLPLITDIVANQNNRVGFSVGRIFAINTLGTVIGVLITGLLLIPIFGIKGSFEFGIAFNLTAAILAVAAYQKIDLKKRFIFSAGLAAVFILYVFISPAWNINASLYGVFKSLNRKAPESYTEFVNQLEKDTLLYYKEGINANVAVTQEPEPTSQKILIINGKPDASSVFDMPTQILLGQIPMMLHNDAKNVFVVGFGSGVTIGSVLKHPVEKIDCAEISSEVIEAGKFFKEENGNCLADPRLSIYNEDALTLLKLSNKKYDVIISEPSNPWIAGIGNLFSQEYFELCKSKLDTNGIMTQWFHLYEVNDEIVKLVLNTFAAVFPHVQVWGGVANDIIIVGANNKISPDYLLMKEKFNAELIIEDFNKIQIDNLFSFFTCQNLSLKGVYLASDGRNINTEIHPILEFAAPRSFYVGLTSNLIYHFDEKFDAYDNRLLLADYINVYPPSDDEIMNAAEYHYITTLNKRFTYGLTKTLLENGNSDFTPRHFYLKSLNAMNLDSYKKNALLKLMSEHPDSTNYKRDYLNIVVKENVNATNMLNVFSIEEESDQFIEITADDSVSMGKLYIQLARNYLLNSEIDLAEIYCGKAVELIDDYPDIIDEIPLAELYYNYAVVNSLKNNFELTFEYYYKLLNTNSGFDRLPILRRLVAWKLAEAKSNQ